MKRKAFALVVHDRPEPCESLKPALRDLGVDTFSVSSCEEAALLLEQTHPQLIFTDTQLPDGTWTDLVNAVEDTAIPTCVVLVASSKERGKFRAATRYRALSFVFPPFENEAVSQLVTRAVARVRARRERFAHAAAA